VIGTTATGVPELDGFVHQGLIRGIYTRLTRGKEATVYCCRAHPSTRRKFLAAKVYREHAARSIRRGAYFEGRERGMKARELRAVRSGSDFGHHVMAGVWMAQEYDCLKRLSAIGANVPRPWTMTGRAILMDYVGNGAGPAPHLDGVDMSPETARRYCEDILDDVRRMLSEHLVHGDLSPYNILVWNDRPWMIDMPQAVDVRFNRNALELLQRDLVNVCTFFQKQGVTCNPHQLAADLWSRYQRVDL
jgi:RIO kinase 1